jgi:hypothetical protein
MPSRSRIPEVVLLAALLLPDSLGAQGTAAGEPSARMARVGRVAAAPLIDGVLDEPLWREAGRLEGFVQTHPGDNTAPSHPTAVLIAFDAQYLYLGILASDDSARVRATVAPRDKVLDDDHVAIYLDTFGDRRRAYVLTFNPLGIQQDGVFMEGTADPDYSVDIVMHSRGRIGPNGWAVEAAIPLRSLRYAAGPGRQWNVQVQRRIKRLDDEQSSWRPIVRGSTGFLTQAGSLGGLEQLPIRRAIEVIPSVIASSQGTRSAGPVPGTEAFQSGAARADVGLSAKVGLAADVTAEFALNPDFAQVEADAPVVTANLRFPILFDEKRPFFLEGIGLFRTPLLVLHTRAIVDPIAAVKLTGKRGATEFGVLAGSDEAPGRFTEAERRNPLLQEEIARQDGRNSQVGLLRLRRAVGEASHIGFLGTAYQFVDRENLTAGADLRITSGSRLAGSLQVTGTWARRAFYDPDLGRDTLRSGRGVGYFLELRRSGRNLNFILRGQGRSPDYVSETGFTPQVNINAWTFETRWDAEPRPNATLISWSAGPTVAAQFDWKGRTTLAYVWPRATFTFPRLTSVNIGPFVDYQRIFEEEFGPRRNVSQAGAFAGPGVRETVWHGFGVAVSTTPDRRWKTSGSLGWSWNVFDYDFGGGPRFPRVSPAALAEPGAPLDPGKAQSFGGTLTVEWSPAAALRVDASYTKSRLTRNDTRRVAHDENLWSAQTVYRFGRFASMRLRADYRTSTGNLRPQFLLAWTPNPGTALYAGYNDDLTRDGFSPITGQFERGIHRNSRTVFLKLSYLVGEAMP